MPGARPVVWISHRDGETCARCGTAITRGSFMVLGREQGVRCLTCEGLADLVYLAAGDAAVTRRALARSARSAVVLKFSKARRRNERQGVLVEASALEQAQAECARDAARREATQARRRVRDETADRAYVAQFAERILELYPGCPPPDAETIAQHACAKYSGRVGRSRAAKGFDPEAIRLAVRAHVRHAHTRYDDLLAQGHGPSEARPLVRALIDEVLTRWREEPGAAAARTQISSAPRVTPGERSVGP